ncbi:polar amino acid transport system permease protein [Pilibacter termitis]|jgi:polar amino acid transport system permease protein|uniref:Polar amino acid transport system permease protein n=1 Tax=Pilibacter termitis TaxID=263852 RepID=A0A1T4QCL9_9ENTE|nr:amino acid ABC transporter permease [Pilibacter termitis]SKA01445.1 polar amino acid transport system permease protein [Pilibacter termitis]
MNKGKIFDIDAVWQAIPKLFKMIPTTVEITLVSMIIGLVLGLLFAVIKMKKIPVLYQMLLVFVSFIRGTPIIVQLYITYTGIPLFLKYLNATYDTNWNVNSVPAMLFVLVTYSFNEAAYQSETIRSALQSVDKGQIEAAESLGMTYPQVFRRIILPEASVVATLPLANALMGLLKGTSVAFVAGVVEMTAQVKIIAGSNFRYFETYLAVAILYWAMNILIEFLVYLLENKLEIKDPRGRGTGLFGRKEVRSDV